MSITGITMTGAKADLLAKITPKENVVIALRKADNKKLIGTSLCKDKFIKDGANVKVPDYFMAKVKQFGMEEKLNELMSYLNKLIVK